MKGPVYLRFGRNATAVFTTPKTHFEIGKANVFKEGSDVTIIACGPLVYEALLVAKKLASIKINAEVINNTTIKPLDNETILKSVRKTGAVVTVEEHQITGGLGGAISELTSKNYPVPIEFVGMPDSFGESGEPEELLKKYGMTQKDIISAVNRVLKRKK